MSSANVKTSIYWSWKVICSKAQIHLTLLKWHPIEESKKIFLNSDQSKYLVQLLQYDKFGSNAKAPCSYSCFNSYFLTNNNNHLVWMTFQIIGWYFASSTITKPAITKRALVQNYQHKHHSNISFFHNNKTSKIFLIILIHQSII